MLIGDDDISTIDFIHILDSLEYSFKKRMKEGPDFNSDIFMSIKAKLPTDWLYRDLLYLATYQNVDQS